MEAIIKFQFTNGYCTIKIDQKKAKQMCLSAIKDDNPINRNQIIYKRNVIR